MARNTGLTEKAHRASLEILDDEQEHGGNCYRTNDKIKHAIAC